MPLFFEESSINEGSNNFKSCYTLSKLLLRNAYETFHFFTICYRCCFLTRLLNRKSAQSLISLFSIQTPGDFQPVTVTGTLDWDFGSEEWQYREDRVTYLKKVTLEILDEGKFGSTANPVMRILSAKFQSPQNPTLLWQKHNGKPPKQLRK